MTLLTAGPDFTFSATIVNPPSKIFAKEAKNLLLHLQSAMQDPKKNGLYSASIKLVERLSLFIQLGYTIHFIGDSGERRANTIRDLETIDFGFGPRGQNTQAALHAKDITTIRISRRDPSIDDIVNFDPRLHTEGLIKLARHALNIPQPKTSGPVDPLARTDEEVLKRLDVAASTKQYVALGASGILAYRWTPNGGKGKLLMHPCLEHDQITDAWAKKKANSDRQYNGTGDFDV